MNAPLSQSEIDAFVLAAHSDLDAVKTMLAEQPALLNENAEWIETAIQAAAHVNRPDIMAFLIDQGAPVDICTAAVLGKGAEVAALLAEFPELIGATGPHNLPLTWYPAIAGHIDILASLVQAGADVSAGLNTNTALHGAAAFNQPQVVRWLLDHEVNPYAVDYEGRLAIDLAAEKGYTEIVAMLEPYTDDDENTP